MFSEETTYNRKSSTPNNFGLGSLLIGIFFWFCIGIIFIDGFLLNGFFWNGIAYMLGEGDGSAWILLGIVVVVLPVTTHFMGLLLGLLGLFAPDRKFAVIGLIVNSILPALLLTIWLYKGSFRF